MIEKDFIERGINKVKLEQFLEEELGRANYSHLDITKTPVSTRITIFAQKPGLVIGKGGHRINEIIEKLKNNFEIENPEVEAEEVREEDLDAEVVAKNIASWLEKGGHPKRVGNTYLNRVMDAGAIGVQIEISGKLSGSRGRTDKFMDGYVKKCGKTSEEYVDKAYTIARTKPGVLGIKVLIMKDVPDYMHRSTKAREMKETLEESEVEEGKAEEEKEEEAEGSKKEPPEKEAEESVASIDYDELVKDNISDIKGRIDEVEELVSGKEYKEIVENILKAEKANKDRKTLKEYLERKLE